jgi:hypothetical protein
MPARPLSDGELEAKVREFAQTKMAAPEAEQLLEALGLRTGTGCVVTMQCRFAVPDGVTPTDIEAIGERALALFDEFLPIKQPVKVYAFPVFS